MSDIMPSVSVIVPAFNAERALPRLIESLRAQTYPHDKTQIIVVDNNSTDRSREVIGQYPCVATLSQSRYQTPGATRNAGLAKATGEVLAFIDADCWADPNWLAYGVDYLLRHNLQRVAGAVRFAFSNAPSIYEQFDSAVNFQQKDFIASQWSGTGNLFVRREVFARIKAGFPVLRVPCG